MKNLISEKRFESKVKNFLKDNGCWYLKTWSNGVQRSGIPDLLICCNGYFLGIELKTERGRPTPLQLRELEMIDKSGGYGYILRPSQFEDFRDVILKLKKRKRGGNE